MDPVTIAASIAAVKTAVGAASNVKDIGSSLQKLFADQEQAEQNKNSNDAKPKTRQQQILRRRAGEDMDAYGDDTSISSVAADVLAEKQNELNIAALGKEIDRKWGMGTWERIQEERTKRLKIKEERELAAKTKAIEKRKHDKELLKRILVEGGKAIAIILSICAVIGGLYWAAERGGSI
tara:strand:+ start:2155 stop:2694 length:540 start_codon:yes stop_codon:yes gene_type:complete